MKASISAVLNCGPTISLAVIGKLNLLNLLFDEIYIPRAVWEELGNSEFVKEYPEIKTFFKKRVKKIKSQNDLILIMDYGESESVILYKELKANYLIIDDKKSRTIAEELGINCVGTLAILIKAKEKGLIPALRPLFEELIKNRRFYSKNVLNGILREQKERMFD